MQDSKLQKNLYDQIADAYTWEERKNLYGQAADAYNRVRPRYPKQLVDRVVELTQLPTGAKLLEVGCGPGTATTAFAKLGFQLVGLEPSRESCLIARQNCAPYPNVEIINTTFEEWELEAEKFHAVLSASAFHWVAAETRHQKAADALQDRGFLILLWNTPPKPDAETEQMLDEVYRQRAPSLRRVEDTASHEKNISKFGRDVIDSGLFENLQSEQLSLEVTYSIEDYLALLSTLSQYIMLKPQQRYFLFAGLQEVLENRLLGSSIKLSYLSVFQVAKKI